MLTLAVTGPGVDEPNVGFKLNQLAHGVGPPCYTPASAPSDSNQEEHPRPPFETIVEDPVAA